MNTLDTANAVGFEKTVFDLVFYAREEIGIAVIKHPLFADKLSTLDKQSIDGELSARRFANDNGGATGSTIFYEEWYEFLEAVQNGDKAAARHELAQCIAMLLRIGIHLDDYMSKYKPA